MFLSNLFKQTSTVKATFNVISNEIIHIFKWKMNGMRLCVCILAYLNGTNWMNQWKRKQAYYHDVGKSRSFTLFSRKSSRMSRLRRLLVISYYVSFSLDFSFHSFLISLLFHAMNT